MILQKTQLQILLFIWSDRIHRQNLLLIETARNDNQHSWCVSCLFFKISYRRDRDVLDMNEERKKVKNKKNCQHENSKW